jgi:hypothetical protein
VTPLKKVAPVVVVQIIKRKSIDFLHPFVRPCVMDGLYKHQPTVEELLVVAERKDNTVEDQGQYRVLADDQLLDQWLALNYHHQRTCGCEVHCHCKEEQQYG